ncbi:MAG: nuclear transport factor 2 family protein, partial [Eudoraea sp.]|nr:nuclear transport factor 2 family protein [Eudoraea sp.]
MNADTLPQNHEALSVYNRMIEVFFYFKSLEDLNETVHEHFMGFGTAAHEFFKNREELSGMARMQAEQLRDQEFTLKRMPVTAKLLDSDTTCLIVEEFELKMHTNEHRLSLRLSTILENIDGKWLVTHFHGSTPDSDIAEEEAFPEEGLKRKNEELEARINERTRELEIEAALERTRGQSLQMQHSSELNEISKIFHQQIRMLGIDSEFSFVWLPNEAAGNHLFWTAWMEGSDPSSKVYTREITYPLDKTESYTAACFTDWESGVPVHEHFVKPEDLDTFFASWEELLAGASKLKAAFFPEGIYYTEAFIKYGCFGIDTRAPLTNEEKSILHRFAVEFERTYTRFLELKKAEAQAREAQVEAALERVRARTMAMQHSDELAEASHLLDKEVRDLGIKTWGCAFNIYREKDAIEWFGNEQGLLPTYTVPREGIFKEYYDLGQEGETLYVKEFSGAECIAHYEYMSTLPVVGDVLKQLKKTNGSFPSYQIDHVVFFKHGYLLFITREPVPEAYDIFRRFAKVFEQTYTRFLDLQKAEAQAREARIENALEKVRSRSIGMQKSEELREVIQVI